MSTMSIKQFLSNEPKVNLQLQKVNKIDEKIDEWFLKSVKFIVQLALVSFGFELVLHTVMPVFIEVFKDVFVGIEGLSPISK